MRTALVLLLSLLVTVAASAASTFDVTYSDPGDIPISFATVSTTDITTITFSYSVGSPRVVQFQGTQDWYYVDPKGGVNVIKVAAGAVEKIEFKKTLVLRATRVSADGVVTGQVLR